MRESTAIENKYYTLCAFYFVNVLWREWFPNRACILNVDNISDLYALNLSSGPANSNLRISKYPRVFALYWSRFQCVHSTSDSI